MVAPHRKTESARQSSRWQYSVFALVMLLPWGGVSAQETTVPRMPESSAPALLPDSCPVSNNASSPTNDSAALTSSDSNQSAGNGSNSADQSKETWAGHFLKRFIGIYCIEAKKTMEPFCDQRFWQKQKETDAQAMAAYYGRCDRNSPYTPGSTGNANGSGNGNSDGSDSAPPPRRALPSPWPAPPFPNDEYQGYPVIGVPQSTAVYPFMKALYGADSPWSEAIKNSRIFFEGWATGSGNWSQAKNSNTPDSYWIVPNSLQLEQLVFKLERIPDTVQTDHIDWGFRSVALYGMDYRYTTAGGWGSDQLLEHNLLYGWDPVEQYFNVYVPGFLGGTDVRVGRWIATPDIETQYSVNNYLASHSLLFTYDTYTQTGVMLSQKINDQWMFQSAIHSGTDMAPWYKGSLATLAAGLRWVSQDNNDSTYTWINALNSSEFRHFEQYGQPLGHDNFNYIVTTWQHRFCPQILTKTESYYMWQRNAELGGTPSAGPIQPFGGGGGDGVLLPGLSQAYGVLNYTMFGLSKRDYLTVRNEWYRDERGMRTGFGGSYTSHTLGLSHQLSDVLMIRPEIGYYRNWHQDAFDLGTKQGIWIYGFDMTVRF